jgi:SPP1 gp7 family putative phage head morphogenesis protein
VPDCDLISEQLNEQLFSDMGLHLVFKPEAMNIFQEDAKQKAQAFAAYVTAGLKPSIAAEIVAVPLPEGVEYADLDAAKEEADAQAQAAQEAQLAAMQQQPAQTDANTPQGDNIPAKALEERRFKAWARKRRDPDPDDFHSHVLSDADKAAILAEMGGGAGQPFFTLTEGPITPDVYKAMVLQLEPGDDSDAEQRAKEQVERKFGRDLADAFDEQLNTLLPADATDEQVRAAPHQVSATSEPVREVLRRSLEQGSSLGTTIAFDTLQNAGIAFDWTLAHAQGARYASTYSYELVRGINATSQTRIQQAVDDWFKERTTLSDLIKELEPTFGKKRARTIAQTETTRAAVEGSRLGYQQSGVVSELQIKIANDEHVCPICGPLSDTRVSLDSEDVPPFHVNCRCWVAPVIKEPGEN